MKNLGKIFEQNFRKSIPVKDEIYYYRLKDTASSYYGGNDNLRFSQSNIADAFMFVEVEGRRYLFIMEYKNHKGKSLPLNCIRKNQFDEMLEANNKLGIIPVIIVFFCDIERCFSLNIEYVDKFKKEEDRKSIPLEYFEKYGVEIETIKIKINYRYNIDKWLQEF